MVILGRPDGALSAAGVTTTILGVYFVALVVETVLALRMVPPALPTAKAT
jgi:hypothetical protein